jgi:MoxR-like ATPase
MDQNTAQETIARLRAEIARVVVGQESVVDRLVIALLIRGHVLVEGLPGLAKTLLVKTLAAAIDASFKRIQFTPDLLPADITGTLILDPTARTLTPRKGPIFANLVLADEINRAPAKVQSALLEAMQERQVTIGDTTYKLPDPFVVIATQNPIEHEGTYALPEAQVDRFVMKLRVDYPKATEELRMLAMYLDPTAEAAEVRRVIALDAIHEVARLAAAVHVDERISRYIVAIVAKTRDARARTRGEGACFHRRPRVRGAGGREVRRPRRAAAPPRAQLRGRRGERDGGLDRRHCVERGGGAVREAVVGARCPVAGRSSGQFGRAAA